ncbi:LOW QUALITY PROTEIN: hypothetical protein PoB_002047300 [Plakobranchus ocellatus]|uniref:Uncharacterized protein n=1 Tax=Plakobranchus ocellatus TaxID=259542 RepID=A0AAV3ZHL2_9GAST|nr:LOW QUALITY PROTEIN: hypothetical protein PoB_002047300 [Plakobranchus ocellatus]
MCVYCHLYVSKVRLFTLPGLVKIVSSFASAISSFLAQSGHGPFPMVLEIAAPLGFAKEIEEKDSAVRDLNGSSIQSSGMLVLTRCCVSGAGRAIADGVTQARTGDGEGRQQDRQSKGNGNGDGKIGRGLETGMGLSKIGKS